MVVRQMVVDAVLLEGRSCREVAKGFGVSKSLVAKLVTRYRASGPEGLIPLSRAHRSDPNKTPLSVEDRIVELRKELSDLGYDHGAATIQSHLATEMDPAPSVSSVARILVRRGFITPEPRKRPTSSFTRFEADQPNELWQSDVTQWALEDGRVVEIVSFLDDHSRLALASRAYATVKGPHVISVFLATAERYGRPAGVLSDNGAVYNAVSRGGRTAFESLLYDLGVAYKHGRPYHPQTQGKIERWHKTLKRFLAKHPAATIPALQSHLDEFCAYYNEVRPHRANARRPPIGRYLGRDKAKPAPPGRAPHYRIRRDVVDYHGAVSLRYKGKMLHFQVGYQHRGQRVILHIVDESVRILNENYRLIGESTINPSQGYQRVKHPR